MESLFLMNSSINRQEILRNLTPAQLEAVTHIDGPLLILAGPGSGKTRVVTHRIANMLAEGVSPRNIVALTFTNKAAAEMKARLERMVGRNSVWMSTFHRFCGYLLRQNASLVGLSENFSIYDTEDAKKQLELAIEESNEAMSHVEPRQIAHAISWAKNNLITPDQYKPAPGNPIGAVTARLYPIYQKRLATANAVDFDDMLMHVAVMLREHPELRSQLDERYKYIMVDEYQDTNFAQYAIVRALSIDHSNLAVTGDPDQSIYGWRGANLKNILDFERDYPSVTVVKLEQNYRSTKAILRVADELIRHNVKRKKKELFTDNGEGEPVRLTAYPTQRDEAEHIAEQIEIAIRKDSRKARDFAIFYRVNALSRVVEQALRERGVPYQVVNGTEFFGRKEIKDVMAFLTLMVNPAADVPLLRIINTPTRGIGKSTIEKLKEHARRYGIPLLDACREAGLVGGLAKKAAVSVAKFVAMMDNLRAHVHDPLEEIVGRVITDSGYRESLQLSESEEDQDRLANLEELLTDAREFDEQHPEGNALEAFLERAALYADTDDWEGESDKVTLMTLHSAKGLEFPSVFIVACENGLLPHERVIQAKVDNQYEEERRLLFVGITRAEEELQLSYAHTRQFRGRTWPTVPSDFLMELPRNTMRAVEIDATSPVPDSDWGAGSGSGSTGSDDFAHESSDDDFNQDAPLKKSKRGETKVAPLVTAADLYNEQMRPKVDIQKFHQGMTVEHPTYGPGEIIALSGVGPKRIASVRFYESPGEEKKFRLLFSELRPTKD